MLSPRFYFLKACYHWLIDSHITPYVLINLKISNVIVPIEYTKNKFIILNISRSAISNFQLNNKKMSFSTCFNGKPYYVELPLVSIFSIYGYENNVGILFEKLKDEHKFDYNDFNFELEKFQFISSFKSLNKFFKKNANNKSQKQFFSKEKKKPNLRIVK